MMTISMSNATAHYEDDVWIRREEEYKGIVNKYTDMELKLLNECFAILVELFEEDILDYLGVIYMNADMNSGRLGQFFTPFHISKFVSDLSIDKEKIEHYKESNEKILISEPCAGGGGMILGELKTLKENGINYQERVRIEAQDLDFRGVYMTYVQLSLCGVIGIVKQGSSISSEIITPDRIFYTPCYNMFYIE